MSLKASVARLKNSKREVTSWVWPWEEAKHFLGAALDAGPGSHFHAWPGLDAEGTPDLHFSITYPDGTTRGFGNDDTHRAHDAKATSDPLTDGGGDEFNNSHPCPGNPGCPK